MNEFELKVRKVSGLMDCFYPGLKALSRRERGKITVENPRNRRRLEGSVKLDGCLNGARWDYLVGYDGRAFFVEIHPVYTSEVSKVLGKLAWLKSWQAHTPFAEERRYFWVATEGVHILKHSREWRLLARKGLKVVSVLKLDREG